MKAVWVRLAALESHTQRGLDIGIALGVISGSLGDSTGVGVGDGGGTNVANELRAVDARGRFEIDRAGVRRSVGGD